MHAHVNDDLVRDVGQLLWVGFDGTSAPEELCRAIAAGEVGAAIVFRRNLELAVQPDGSEQASLGALMDLCDALHGAVPAGLPRLWIAVDQEGGRVQRVRAPATVWPPMLTLNHLDDAAAEALAERVGEAMGRELAALGFDIDFAPVLDVHTNPANPIIGDRAFACEPERAATRALGFARGLEQAGVIACGKHFPGHGDTSTDSHLELPRLEHDLARLEAVELLPFRRAAAAKIPMIMTAHVVFAALDEHVPATLSPRVITELLRTRLGFGGIVVSDDLDMNAIAAHVGIADAAVRAIAAGCDALLLCRDLEHQRMAYEALIKAGEATSRLRARIGESAARIRAVKRDYQARASLRAPSRRDALVLCGGPEHRGVAARLAHACRS